MPISETVFSDFGTQDSIRCIQLLNENKKVIPAKLENALESLNVSMFLLEGDKLTCLWWWWGTISLIQ